MKFLHQKVLSLIVAMFIMVLLANIAHAQQRGQQGPPPVPSDKEIAKLVTDLSKELSLDEKHEAQITLLYVAYFEEVSDKMESGRPSRDEMEKLKSELENEVKDYLTADQIAKYEAYLKDTSAQNRRGRPGGGR